MPASRVIKLPANISDRLAAGMMVRGMTARTSSARRIGLNREAGFSFMRRPAASEPFCASGPSSWVRRSLARSAATRKLRVRSGTDATTSSISSEGELSDEVKALTNGEGVNAVYDSIGRATFEQSAQSLRRRGVLISFGEASGEPDPIPPRRLGQLGSLYLTHPSVPEYTATRDELLTTATNCSRWSARENPC